MKKFVTILALLMFFPISTVFAVKLTNLYQAEIPLASQTEDLKEQAIENGFKQVLIRLSGNPTITQNPIIRDSLMRSDYYVQDIAYSPVTTSSSEYLLQIRYDSADVNRLFKKARIPVWDPNNRPLMLVWLVVTNQNNQTMIVNNQGAGGLYSTLTEAANKLGLPLIFPMMDMDDLNEVSTNDIKAMVIPVLKSAAERYGPDVMLVGSMDENPQGWDSDWELLANKTKWQWRVVDKTSDAVITSAINQAGLTLSKNYLGKSSNG